MQLDIENHRGYYIRLQYSYSVVSDKETFICRNGDWAEYLGYEILGNETDDSIITVTTFRHLKTKELFYVEGKPAIYEAIKPDKMVKLLYG